MVHFFRSSTVDLVQVYLAGQLGHLSGQIDVWAVGQRTSTAGLLPRFVTVADLNKMRSHNNHQAGREPTVGLFNVAYATTYATILCCPLRQYFTHL